jgi:hypothetical protein
VQALAVRPECGLLPAQRDALGLLPVIFRLIPHPASVGTSCRPVLRCLRSATLGGSVPGLARIPAAGGSRRHPWLRGLSLTDGGTAATLLHPLSGVGAVLPLPRTERALPCRLVAPRHGATPRTTPHRARRPHLASWSHSRGGLSLFLKPPGASHGPCQHPPTQTNDRRP